MADAAAEYVPRAILVTGGAGFSFSYVIDALLARYPGVPLVNLDRMDACASEHNNDGARASPSYVEVRGDVGDMPLVRRLLREHRIDTVLHAAAQTHVDNSFSSDVPRALAFTRDNVEATQALLECCKEVRPQVRRFVYVSTDEVYGDDYDTARDEATSALKPTNPYAASKVGAEAQCFAYARSYGIPMIRTRGNNIWGARQYPEKVMPRFTMQLLAGLPCTVHGAGASRRTFAHVSDVARAFLAILAHGTTGVDSVYNIGGTDELSVGELAERLVRIVKPGEPVSRWLRYVRDRDFNDRHYSISSSRLEALGWSPQVRLDDAALADFVAWYREHAATWWERLPPLATASSADHAGAHIVSVA